MILSTAHLAARADAARHPANVASLALLAGGAARIEILDATAAVLAIIVIPVTPGTADAGTRRIELAAPLEGVVVAVGTPASARIKAHSGALWADDISVTDQAGEGEIRLESLALAPGKIVRLVSAIFQG